MARLFSIVWIMVGLTVCSVMTATFTTALATAAVKDVDLVGKKVKYSLSKITRMFPFAIFIDYNYRLHIYELNSL